MSTDDVRRLPQAIRIGPVTYTIIEVTGLRDEDGKQMWGQVLHGPCRIEIEANLGYQQQYHTLWHEIIHTLMNQAELDKKDDEQLVNVLAYGLLGVMRDNGDLLDWRRYNYDREDTG